VNKQIHCPLCDASLGPGEIVAAGRFFCRACRGEVQASKAYGRWIFLGTLFLLIAIFWFLGFRGQRLIYAVLVAFVPLDVLAVRTLKYLIPPNLEPYVPNPPFGRGDGPHLFE
jgi:hypothetical protein